MQPTTTQIYFNSNYYPYMCAACFGLYLDHPQVCQYKRLYGFCIDMPEEVIRSLPTKREH